MLVSVSELEFHTCWAEIVDCFESPDGFLNIPTESHGMQRFRPVEWRILED
jgi:Lon protease-like protein